MTIRMDYLGAKLTAFLDRKAPPRNLPEGAQPDEIKALVRALDRAAPANDFESWWPRFEDALEAGMKTRVWPNVGDLAKAAKDLPSGAAGPDGPKMGGPEWVEAVKQRRLRAWAAREKDAAVAARDVTIPRLAAIGIHGAAADDERARAAAHLHADGKGLTVQQVGWDMGITTAEAQRLIERHRDRRTAA